MKQSLKFTLGFAFLSSNILVLLAVSFSIYFFSSGYFEAFLTATSMIFKNDTSLMNANGLRIKKVNRTYVLTGLWQLQFI